MNLDQILLNGALLSTATDRFFNFIKISVVISKIVYLNKKFIGFIENGALNTLNSDELLMRKKKNN